RDVVEASLVVNGAPVVVMDTAGLRQTDDVVESMGVERSRAALEEADGVVVVFDRSVVLDAEDRAAAAAVGNRRCIAVLNKADLPVKTNEGDVRALLGAVPVVEMSALTGTGTGALASAIGRLLAADGLTVPDEEALIFRTRHHEAARRALDDVRRAEGAA